MSMTTMTMLMMVTLWRMLRKKKAKKQKTGAYPTMTTQDALLMSVTLLEDKTHTLRP